MKISIRSIIITLSTIVSLTLCIVVFVTYPLASLRIIKLSQWSSLLSIVYLYVSLLISPLYALWPKLPLRSMAIRARRAIGVSGWGFATLHSLIAFFGQLAGIAGLAFLSNAYLIAVGYGVLALVIFSLMTVTSTDRAIALLGKQNWKWLHRLTYIASFAIVIHAYMLGTHFRGMSESIPTILNSAVTFLILIELYRLSTHIARKYIRAWEWSATLTGLFAIIALLFALAMQSAQNTLSVHPSHTDGTHLTHGINATDYTLDLSAQTAPTVGQSTAFAIQIKDNSTQLPVSGFVINHEKLMHLVTVDDSLDWFSHEHPELTGDTFQVKLTFPHPGTYHLFATFQEFGKIERTLLAQVSVPESTAIIPMPTPAPMPPIDIELSSSNTINGKDLLSGKSPIIFRVLDPKTHAPIAKIDTYLGTLGHLVMIRKEGLNYVHIHPSILPSLFELLPPQNKEIPFVPPAGHGPIISGAYRMYAEFSVNGVVTVRQFEITVE